MVDVAEFSALSRFSILLPKTFVSFGGGNIGIGADKGCLLVFAQLEKSRLIPRNKTVCNLIINFS